MSARPAAPALHHIRRLRRSATPVNLLLLHLSDIHFKSAKDAVLRRGDAIVDAVRNLDYDIDLAVVAVTGDVAFSGLSDQYNTAAAFLGRIVERLKIEL